MGNIGTQSKTIYKLYASYVSFGLYPHLNETSYQLPCNVVVSKLRRGWWHWHVITLCSHCCHSDGLSTFFLLGKSYFGRQKAAQRYIRGLEITRGIAKIKWDVLWAPKKLTFPNKIRVENPSEWEQCFVLWIWVVHWVHPQSPWHT